MFTPRALYKTSTSAQKLVKTDIGKQNKYLIVKKWRTSGREESASRLRSLRGVAGPSFMGTCIKTHTEFSDFGPAVC